MHMNGEPDGPPMFVELPRLMSEVGVHAFAALGYA